MDRTTKPQNKSLAVMLCRKYFFFWGATLDLELEREHDNQVQCSDLIQHNNPTNEHKGMAGSPII